MRCDDVAGEREIKKIHLSMLIRIKNSLTPEQVAQLRQIRSAAHW
jgi:hypothetical protein